MKIASPELAVIMGIGTKHAGYHLKNMRQNGLIEVVAKRKASNGNKIYIYSLKPLGVDLLEFLDGGVL